MKRRFAQLDVFTDRPLGGNPLACLIDAEGLDDGAMAAFARWTNLSETTFLLPPTDPESDYRVRIFTPSGELPFAGHPTLGSAAAWRAAGGVPRRPGRIVQQCGIGRVEVREVATHGAPASRVPRLAFAAPPLRRTGPPDAATLEAACAALGLTPSEAQEAAWVDNGPGWLALRLADGERVRRLRPDFAAMGRLKIGVCGLEPAGAATQLEVRAFAPGLGVPEDPVTGSLNAGIALWLQASQVLPSRYVAAQGGALGREGRVHVEREDGTCWIGGDVVTIIEGQAALG